MRKKTEEEERRKTEQAEAAQPGTAAEPEDSETGAEDGARDPAPADGPEQKDPAAEEETDAQQRIRELEKQLLEARCRLDAIAAGVAPEMVDDAVTLAVQEAKKGGAVTGETVAVALEQVLQRHPEWKNSRRRTGGFRLGADAEESPRRTRPDQDERKRWNRFR